MKNFQEQNVWAYVKWGIAVVVVVILLCGSFYKVSPGHRGVLITLGKVEQRSYVNGVGLKWPFISSMEEMNIQTNELTDSTSSYTADVQTANLKYTFTYELNPETVHQLYEQVGRNYLAKKVKPVLNDVLKDVIGKWQAQDLVANRDKARVDVLAGLNESIDKQYFQNLTFQIIDLGYSDNFEKAIENKVIAEQKALEAVNNTKRIKEEAEQTLISARAAAEAMQIKSEALARNKGLTEYEAVQKWDGKLPQYMMGNSVPLLNLNANH